MDNSLDELVYQWKVCKTQMNLNFAQKSTQNNLLIVQYGVVILVIPPCNPQVNYTVKFIAAPPSGPF